MGEVWHARDTKLGREVAIKTLPDEFANDSDRIARFQREAKLLASLNHPNIAAIHGLEEDGGVHFLVLELVEGDTLADRLTRGAVPVEESLTLALQIAEALEAAHEKGVIHRDLKPANIKVTPDGKVKVLDFGLAKAFAGDQQEVSPANSPTLSMQATQQGVILGTAAYMSPEQARGEATDQSADVWAFGVVLFEMLTGRETFDGKTVSDILATVLKLDPDWQSLPPNLHPKLRLDGHGSRWRLGEEWNRAVLFSRAASFPTPGQSHHHRAIDVGQPGADVRHTDDLRLSRTGEEEGIRPDFRWPATHRRSASWYG